MPALRPCYYDVFPYNVRQSFILFAVVLLLLATQPLHATVTERVLHSFVANGSAGEPALTASLVLASDGDFYGTTPDGGTRNQGCIFETTPAGALTVLHSFGDGSTANDGVNPAAGLTIGRDGNFYGTTVQGGAADGGTVFKMTPAGVVSIMHSFGVSVNDALQPYAALIVGKDGNFYGTTSYGGDAYEGTVYEMTPAGTVTILHSFGVNYNDGNNPDSALVQGSNGSLYGVTPFTIGYGYGIIFEISPGGSETVLHDFGDHSTAHDGEQPQSPLVFDSNGNMYGATIASVDSMSAGVIFELTSGGIYHVVYSFASTSTSEGSPYGPLLIGSDGSLFGTTDDGGQYGYGTVFEVSPSGLESLLYSFGEPSIGVPSEPYSGLSMGSDGNLYGTTTSGGNTNSGTIFAIYPNGIKTSTNIYDFNGDGHNDLIWSNSMSGQVSTWLMNGSSKLGPLEEGPTLATIVPSTEWSLSTISDLNGDGHPDLIWHNSKTGQLSTWLMDGTKIMQEGPVIATVPELSANVISCPDIVGDGQDDLLWYDSSSGNVSVWLMNGTTVVQSGMVVGKVAPSTGWHPIGTADFDGDGHPDILWENSITGGHSVWYMEGTQLRNYSAVFATNAPSTGWQVKSVADYDGDGHPDLIFENDQTGQVSVMFLTGTGGIDVKQSGPVFATVAPSSGWSISGGK